MKRRCIVRVALPLAFLTALRALLPVGYMLAPATAGPLPLQAVLCPAQNPGLDLGGPPGAPSHAHHHHHHHAPAGAAPTDRDDGANEARGAACKLWISSLGTIPGTFHSPPALPDRVAATAPVYTAMPPVAPTSWRHRPRGPPVST